MAYSAWSVVNFEQPDVNKWNILGENDAFLNSSLDEGQVAFDGLTEARTFTLPDANATLARIDAGQTFTGVNTMTSPVFNTSISTPSIITASGALGITPAAGSGIATTLSGLGRHKYTGSQIVTGSATTAITGTINPTASTSVTGVNTLFTTELVVGDRITVSGETRTVTVITSDTALTVDTAFTDTANDTSPDRLAAIAIFKKSDGTNAVTISDIGGIDIIGYSGVAKSKEVGIINTYAINTADERVAKFTGYSSTTREMGGIEWVNDLGGGADNTSRVKITTRYDYNNLSVVFNAGRESVTMQYPINYAADAQASDTYVITLAPAITAYVTGQQIIFKANTINTGAASINVNGLGAKTIVKRLNTALANGDILAGMFCLLIYDGTNFVLMNPVVN